MADTADRFLAAGADPQVAALAGDGRPAFLVDRSGSRVVWTNGAGAAWLGVRVVDDLDRRGFAAGSPAARRIAALAGQLSQGQERTERIALPKGMMPQPVVCRASRVILGAERMVLLVVVDGTGNLSASDASARFAALAAPARPAAAPVEPVPVAPVAAPPMPEPLPEPVAAAPGAVDDDPDGPADGAAAPDGADEPEAAPAEPAVFGAAAAEPIDDAASDSREAAVSVAEPIVEPAEPVAAEPAASELPPAPDAADAVLTPDEPEAIGPADGEPATGEPDTALAAALAAAPAGAPPQDAAAMEPADAARAASARFAAPVHGRTVRFVFELDGSLQFGFVSDDLAAAVGPRAADVVGLGWTAVAARLGLDPLGRVDAALRRRDTFTGLTVDWPVQDTAARIPVDLAGMPVFGRDRAFRGYRGFGVAKTGALFEAPMVVTGGADAAATPGDMDGIALAVVGGTAIPVLDDVHPAAAAPPTGDGMRDDAPAASDDLASELAADGAGGLPTDDGPAQAWEPPADTGGAETDGPSAPPADPDERADAGSFAAAEAPALVDEPEPVIVTDAPETAAEPTTADDLGTGWVAEEPSAAPEDDAPAVERVESEPAPTGGEDEPLAAAEAPALVEDVEAVVIRTAPEPEDAGGPLEHEPDEAAAEPVPADTAAGGVDAGTAPDHGMDGAFGSAVAAAGIAALAYGTATPAATAAEPTELAADSAGETVPEDASERSAAGDESLPPTRADGWGDDAVAEADFDRPEGFQPGDLDAPAPDEPAFDTALDVASGDGSGLIAEGEVLRDDMTALSIPDAEAPTDVARLDDVEPGVGAVAGPTELAADVAGDALPEDGSDGETGGEAFLPEPAADGSIPDAEASADFARPAGDEPAGPAAEPVTADLPDATSDGVTDREDFPPEAIADWSIPDAEASADLARLDGGEPTGPTAGSGVVAVTDVVSGGGADSGEFPEEAVADGSIPDADVSAERTRLEVGDEGEAAPVASGPGAPETPSAPEAPVPEAPVPTPAEVPDAPATPSEAPGEPASPPEPEPEYPAPGEPGPEQPAPSLPDDSPAELPPEQPTLPPAEIPSDLPVEEPAGLPAEEPAGMPEEMPGGPTPDEGPAPVAIAASPEPADGLEPAEGETADGSPAFDVGDGAIAIGGQPGDAIEHPSDGIVAEAASAETAMASASTDAAAGVDMIDDGGVAAVDHGTEAVATVFAENQPDDGHPPAGMPEAEPEAPIPAAVDDAGWSGVAADATGLVVSADDERTETWAVSAASDTDRGAEGVVSEDEGTEPWRSAGEEPGTGVAAEPPVEDEEDGERVGATSVFPAAGLVEPDESTGDVTWREPEPPAGEVIPSPIVPRMVPRDGLPVDADRRQLSRPEREAFQKIAEALGARLEGVPATFELGGMRFEAAPLADGRRPETVSETPLEPVPTVADVPRLDLGSIVPPHPAGIAMDVALLDKVPVALAILKDGEAVAVNRAFLDLTGYADFPALQAAGGFSEAFAGSALPRDASLPAIRRRDGVEVPVSARLHSIPWSGGGVASLVVVQEVAAATGRDRAAAAEQRVEELEAILDTATDGVLVLDGKGLVVGANKSAEALFGAERGAMVGEPLVNLLAPESHRSALDYLDGLNRNGLSSLLNDGREVIGRVRQGGLVPLFMTVGRVSAGKFCAVLRDITQWKRAEEELTAAKRSAETASSQKSDFLAKISHEIRTPLNAIIGFSEVMMEERFGPVGSERYKEYLRDIHISGAHIMSLVNDLLDLSKIEAGKLDLSFEAVSANDVIRECVALMQPQANRERIIIRTSLSSSLPAVVADSRSLRQIVLNLVSNAIKFNNPGGQVIVSTLYEDTGEVAIRVRDTGPGMSEDDIVKALEPFRQLHTARPGRGTGLGLPLTKALVEANRAGFRIDSAIGQGTLVQITFPSTRVLAE